ncbi:Phosphoglycerol transferase [Bifidobacterium animalis subsp. lactis ATCC 27673]|uniref:LTA synthase family protein n=1 Tax=Bifidobacterium animalis TaxID=28025 RepID=UPI0003B08374|nr:alkaline phosphatase family protein [Bifidobacterium animalis]AGW85686.1 Phosphoglycerol transferase [Bifidobacterium animalis subsp. lactis ATCC 27673]KOA46719.1 phosphoglycerol transferase [Bifidobacterium animalis subsp. lactis ATCC 27673]
MAAGNTYALHAASSGDPLAMPAVANHVTARNGDHDNVKPSAARKAAHPRAGVQNAAPQPTGEKNSRRVNPVTRQWRRFKETKFYEIWNKRPKFSYGAYTVVFIAMVILATMFLWWSTNTKLKYDPASELNFLQQVTGDAYHYLSSASCYLNMIALVLIYLLLVTLVNRFWVGTALFGAFVMVFAVATKIKITMRSEPIIPSDLGFLSGGGGGGAGDVASFVTDDSRPLVNTAIAWLVWFVVICVILQCVDKRRAFIYCSWRHPIAGPKNIFGLICRILAPIVSVLLLISYAGVLSNPQAPQRKTLSKIGYSPTLWNVQQDAETNGALTTFLSLTRVKAMEDEPEYSQAAMQQIKNRYAQAADEINAQRSQNLTDNTVVMILSESFSDPNRVPNVHFGADPMPNIRALGQTTTSGLMLSPGYGGGTANIEFQQMTGLNMANFSDTLLSPYQQLVATRPKFYSFNQMWNEHCGDEYSTSCSIGYHPFKQFFYLRGVNYKKFGFSHLYTLDSDPKIAHGEAYVGPNGTKTEVSDEEAYKNVVEEIRTNTEQNKPSQYIQLITMQNHAPYPDLYGSENEFHGVNETPDTVPERGIIATYAKNVQRTDEATANFLNELDGIDKPITVVFYGDHLPGIYNTANADKNNALTLHETNYFIWSNRASASHDVKLPESDAAYTSSNYFMTQAAEQMNARISPYLALLDELHAEVPAMSRSVNAGVWSAKGEPTLLDDNGEVIDTNTLSSKAKQLLADYKMVQYDMSVGKNYLMDMGFMDIPKQ